VGPLERALRSSWTCSAESADAVAAPDGVGTVVRTRSIGDA
jgi:hypothetical protein